MYRFKQFFRHDAQTGNETDDDDDEIAYFTVR